MSFDPIVLVVGADTLGVLESYSGSPLSYAYTSEPGNAPPSVVTTGLSAARPLVPFVTTDGESCYAIAPAPIKESAYVGSGVATVSGTATAVIRRCEKFTSTATAIVTAGTSSIVRRCSPTAVSVPVSISGTATAVIRRCEKFTSASGTAVLSGSATISRRVAYAASLEAEGPPTTAITSGESVVTNPIGGLFYECASSDYDALYYSGGVFLFAGIGTDDQFAWVTQKTGNVYAFGSVSYYIGTFCEVFNASGGIIASGHADIVTHASLVVEGFGGVTVFGSAGVVSINGVVFEGGRRDASALATSISVFDDVFTDCTGLLPVSVCTTDDPIYFVDILGSIPVLGIGADDAAVVLATHAGVARCFGRADAVIGGHATSSGGVAVSGYASESIGFGGDFGKANVHCFGQGTVICGKAIVSKTAVGLFGSVDQHYHSLELFIEAHSSRMARVAIRDRTSLIARDFVVYYERGQSVFDARARGLRGGAAVTHARGSCIPGPLRGDYRKEANRIVYAEVS